MDDDGIARVARDDGQPAYHIAVTRPAGRIQFHFVDAPFRRDYYVDGKVFLAPEGGELFAFRHVKAPKTLDETKIADAKDDAELRVKLKAVRAEVEKEYLLAKMDFDAPIRSTPVVANGVIYVMTENALYAFKKK